MFFFLILASFHKSLSTRIPARNSSKAGAHRNANPEGKCPSHGQLNTTLWISSSKPIVKTAMDPYNKDRLVFLNNTTTLESKAFMLQRLNSKLMMEIRTTVAYEGCIRMQFETEVLGFDSRGFYRAKQTGNKDQNKKLGEKQEQFNNVFKATCHRL